MAFVFLSYRRKSSSSVANYVKLIFEQAGFSVYLDVAARPEIGPLDDQIKQQIEACSVFLCLLEASTLESEWVQREIDYAHDLDKPRLFALQENFKFPTQAISEGVKSLLSMRGEKLYDQDNHFYAETVDNLVAAVRHLTQSFWSYKPIPFRVLIVEDDFDWMERAQKALLLITQDLDISEAFSYEEGLKHIQTKTFDAVILDVKLGESDDGLKLARALRNASHQSRAGLILFTFFANVDIAMQAFKEFHPVISQKNRFTDEIFAKETQQSVREWRWNVAERQAAKSKNFIFQFHGSQLRAGGLANNPQIASSITDFSDIDYRQRLELFQKQAANNTSASLQSSGLGALSKDIHDHLLTDPSIRTEFDRAVNTDDAQVSLTFLGTSLIQREPFEAIQINGKLGALQLPIIRQWQNNGGIRTPFSPRFFQELDRMGNYFQVLLVGNEEEREFLEVKKTIEINLRNIGVLYAIHSTSNVKSMLSFLHDSTIAIHMIHITNSASQGMIAISPTQLTSTIMQNNGLRFAYINGWIAAQTWDILNAFVMSGTPSLVAYQLPVIDTFCAQFACEFYNQYFRFFSVGQALMRARQKPLFLDFDKISALCVDVR